MSVLTVQSVEKAINLCGQDREPVTVAFLRFEK
jgi:hypothetical protein